jgi:hypothetical protein
VQDDVAITVRKHAAAVRHADAAQHDVVAFTEGMDVETLADADGE